jgi:hypothetical protein
VTGGIAGHAEPLRVAHTVWVGFGPLFIAEEKGSFARAGVVFRADGRAA